MSRSQPNESSVHPCGRWLEWNGENGSVRYYDKDKKESVDIGKDFTFILLDELATITGYNDKRKSRIGANEIRDSREEPFIVKFFDGNELIAQGLYADIKEKIERANGGFTTNLYLAFKGENGLMIGSLKIRGAALGAWMDFKKANRANLYKNAVRINGSKSGKKGKVEFETPIFELRDISDTTNAEATELDKQLQVYLKAYFAKTSSVREQRDGPSDDEDRTDYSQDDKREDYDQRTDTRASNPAPLAQPQRQPARLPEPERDDSLDMESEEIPFN